MGTRSLTIVYDVWENEKPRFLVSMYRQFDGYVSGHGMELYEFLKDMYIVNGLGSNQPERVANGAGCLAAQIVAHFKNGPGGIYITTGDDELIDYVYRLYVHEPEWTQDFGRIELVVENFGEQIFSGSLEEFMEWSLTDERVY